MPNNIDRYKQDLDIIEAGAQFKCDIKTKLMLELAAQTPPPAPEEKPADSKAEETQEGEASPKPQPEPQTKKGKTVRFPHWLRPATAAVLLTIVGISAVWALTNRGNTATELSSPYDGPLEPMEEAADADGGEMDEAAAADAAESYAMAGAAEGYFATEGGESRAALTAPESFTVGEMESASSGYQGVLLYGFEEYNGLRLGGADIPGTLPVFRNTAQLGTANATLEGKAAELEAIGYEMLEVLDLPLQSIGHHEQNTISYVEFGCDGARIQVYADESVQIWFDEAQPVANGASTAPGTAEAWEDLAHAVVWQYNGLFAGMAQPTVEVLLDRTFGGDALWYITVYDGGGTFAERLQSRSLRAARLVFDDAGRLLGVNLYRKDTQPLGRYPTIGLAAATAALEAGDSVTTVPYPFPGTEAIAGVDLVYLATGHEESYLPFYLFYVDLSSVEKLPDDADDGLVSYGMWYVPALDGEYVNSGDGQPFFG